MTLAEQQTEPLPIWCGGCLLVVDDVDDDDGDASAIKVCPQSNFSVLSLPSVEVKGCSGRGNESSGVLLLRKSWSRLDEDEGDLL